MSAEPQKNSIFSRDFGRSFKVMVKGEGVYLYDQEGNKYIDGTSGIAVCSLGHGVKRVVDAVAQQLQTLAFTTTVLFESETAIRLADAIRDFTPADLNYSYFVSGGSEGNETAIKLARQYWMAVGRPSKYMVISRWQSYHGNTMGALAVSGLTSRRRPYTPLLKEFAHIAPPYCYRCPFGRDPDSCGLMCAHDLERVLRQVGPENVSAFIAEPIVGAAGGAITPPPGYYQVIREICDRYDILFIDDEVICGFARTGKKFGIEHWNVIPDMMVTAKGLGGGYAPLGAVIVRSKVYDAFHNRKLPFVHGYTFSGNPGSCSAGIEIIKILEEQNLVQQSADRGELLFSLLRSKIKHEIVGEIRGKGLLAGVEFVKDRDSKKPFAPDVKIGQRVFQKCLERGLVVYPCFGHDSGDAGDSILICPPYVVTEQHVWDIVAAFRDALDAVEAETRSL